jgi:iron complex transport system substrate-binding protein
LGIKVVDFPLAKGFSHLCGQFLELAGIVGKEKQATEIVRQAEIQVDMLKQEVRDFSRPKVFIQIGARPLFTATKESFFNDFIEFAGGINIASGAKSGLYSREKVLEDNPDIIIITTMGIAGEREKEIWRTFETLNAVKNNRIYIVDDYNFCSPTPLSFVEALEEMIEILHSEDE